MKPLRNIPPYFDDREFYFILTGSFLFYLLLIFVFFHLPVDSNRRSPTQTLFPRKITMAMPPQPASKPLPPSPAVKPEKKPQPAPIVPQKVEKPAPPPAVRHIEPEPKIEVPPPPKESSEEFERKREEQLALQRAKDQEKNREVAKNKFTSLFGNTTDEVLQNKGLNVITTAKLSSNPVKKGTPDGGSSEDLQIQINSQEVDQILKGLPSGKEKKGDLLGEHQTKIFDPAGHAGNKGGTGKVGSTRTPEEFERAFKAYEGRLKSYYDKAIQTDPLLKGVMVVRITIASDGSVLKCDILSSELRNKKFESEIAQIIQEQFKFSKIVQGEEFHDRALNFHPDK